MWIARHRSVDWRFAAGISFICGLLAGCTGATGRWASWSPDGWVADYDTAEARVRDGGQPLLIYFKSDRAPSRDPIRTALDQPMLPRRIDRYVRCTLFRSYEPDRRYVAQFGVERAPALIVVHPDGSYHATSGHLEASGIASFLAGAAPPGRVAAYDPHIPRRPREDWLESLDVAEQVVRATDRPLLVVYARRFCSDWGRMRRLLDRAELVHRLTELVRCRIEVGTPFTDATITPFGALKLPAMVLARPDGTFDTLEMPTSLESVARFVDRSTNPSASATGVGAAASTASAGSASPR